MEKWNFTIVHFFFLCHFHCFLTFKILWYNSQKINMFDCKKCFLQILSQKKPLRLWISKIRIWIRSEETTLRVDLMDPWSVFGFDQNNGKSVFGFGNPDLDFPKTTHPMFPEQVHACWELRNWSPSTRLVWGSFIQDHSCMGICSMHVHE